MHACFNTHTLTLSLPTILFDTVSSEDNFLEKAQQTKNKQTKKHYFNNCVSILVNIKSWNSSRTSNDILYVDIKMLCQCRLEGSERVKKKKKTPAKHTHSATAYK